MGHYTKNVAALNKDAFVAIFVERPAAPLFGDSAIRDLNNCASSPQLGLNTEWRAPSRVAWTRRFSRIRQTTPHRRSPLATAFGIDFSPDFTPISAKTPSCYNEPIASDLLWRTGTHPLVD
jgi:hypothetical protein